MKQVKARVEAVRPLTAEMVEMTLALPQSMDAQPGQFAHIAVPGDGRRLLRRPISVYSAKANQVALAIQCKGEGTRRICAAMPGESLDILYPLGRGFQVQPGQKLCVVGGGVGVAPLRYALERFGGADCTAILGFRSQAQVYGVSEMAETGAHVWVCTEDGSVGVKGLVTRPLEELLRLSPPDLILACGPTPMLRAVQELALRYGVAAQLSLEEHMGCGLGACLTCNCAVRAKDGIAYKRVCVDGPVFDAGEVVFL